MAMLSDWGDLLSLIPIAFAAVNTLILVPWRKSLKHMLVVSPVILIFTLMVTSYLHYYTNCPPGLIILFIDVLWAAASFWFAQYRDARTMFLLLSVWVFSMVSITLTFVCGHSVESLPLRVLIAFGIHLLFPFCIWFLMRSNFAALMRLGKKGWIWACFIPIVPFLSLRVFSLYPSPFRETPIHMPAAAMLCILTIFMYIVIAKFSGRILEQKKQEQLLDIMTAQAQNAESQLAEAARQEKQSAILRHDMRHFANLIDRCINEHLYEEARDGVKGLLSHPAMCEPETRYCKNPTLNALLRAYAQKAKEMGIKFRTGIVLKEELHIETIELAVLLSNTLENAFNACHSQPENAPREVFIKLHMAGEQLFISISNTCAHPVAIDADSGLPQADPAKVGHGVGMISVQSFLRKYSAQADCVQENGWFQLRIVASAVERKKEPVKRSTRAKLSILRVNLAISLLIIAGFCLAGLNSMVSFEKLFKTDIEVVSELTSENIYANINNHMERPINVSLAMSHDVLLQELIENESKNGMSSSMTKKIQEYLTSYQNKYGFDSVFLISEKTKAYYYYQSGVSRIVSPDNPEDVWYFDYRKEDLDCKLNIDNNKAKDYSVTIFVDCKLKSADGTLLGVVGVGMETPYIQELLQQTEQKYNLDAYLIDAGGEIQLSSGLTKLENVNLFENEQFADMAGAIVENKVTSEQKWYSDGKLDGYIITKYIPNLNWYLVVEKDTSEFTDTMFRQLFAGFLFMVLVVTIVIFITNKILTCYHGALMGLAEKDPLTGLRNRACYEQEMHLYGARLSDYARFGIGIFDLNYLKRTNDELGHQAGDAYLKAFAALLCVAFPHCPAFRIGGDEFLLVFINMEEREVNEKWELFKLTLNARSESGPIQNSAAFGYAFRNTDTLLTIEQIFKEADRRMYANKEAQRAQRDTDKTT